MTSPQTCLVLAGVSAPQGQGVVCSPRSLWGLGQVFSQCWMDGWAGGQLGGWVEPWLYARHGVTLEECRVESDTTGNCGITLRHQND